MPHYQALKSKAEVWVRSKLTNFDPLEWTEKKAAYTRRKAFAELAIYAYVMGDDIDPVIEQFITDIANHPDYHRLLLRNPRQLLLYSAPLAYVINRDTASKATRSVVADAISRPQVFAVERSAHRLMDLWQFLSLVDARPKWLSASQILDTSALAHPPTSFDCTLSEAYALTHDVLFLKNFGVDDARLAESISHQLDTSSCALTVARFIAEGNSDITLELLMCLGMMGQLNGNDCKLVLDWIIQRNGDKAFICGPRFDPDAEMAYSGLDAEWVANYHTTLVGLSTLTLCQRGRWADQIAPPELFATDIEDVIKWGGVVQALNQYEIPKALALIESIDHRSMFGSKVVQEVTSYLKDITDAETGFIGYWTDEMKAARHNNMAEGLDTDLRRISTLADEVLAPVGEAA